MSDEYTRHGRPVAGGNFPLDGFKWKWHEIEDGVHAPVVTTAGCIGSDALRAAREDRSFCQYANSVTPGAAAIVLTNATLVYNLLAGMQLIVTGVAYQIETGGDNCLFWLGSTDELDGAGTFTPRGMRYHAFTSGALSRETKRETLLPPKCFKYSNGVRSVTVQVDANDALCTINCGFCGWVEFEQP